MLQINVDETGLDGRSPWLIFSALMGTVTDWTAASERWRVVLDESPRIRYFKMNEAARISGEFFGFSEEARNSKLVRLAQTLRGEYGFIEQTLTCDLTVVVPELKKRSRKPADSPYFWSFHHLISAVGLSLLTVSEPVPFQIIFDDNPRLGSRAKAWWPVVRAMQEPPLRALLPVEPLLRDDHDWVPLQAADLTAWMSLADRKGNNSFSWLRQHLVGITRSPHCVEFGLKEIVLMFDGDGVTPPEQWRIDAARDAFKQTFIDGRARHYVPRPPKQKKRR